MFADRCTIICSYSVRTGAMNRSLRLRNTRCGLSSYTNVYPRAPIVICGCIYTIRCERARWIGPLRLRNVLCDCLCAINVYSTYTNVYATYTHCDAWLHLYNSCGRAR